MSFTAKKLISSLFLTISLSSALFLLPNESRADNGSPTVTLTDPVFGCTWGGEGILNCLLKIEYNTIVGAGRWVWKTASLIFDTLWAFGLSSETYKQDDFIGAGWIVCRDISNTFFIFILLYIAITTILQMGDNKKLLSTLIIVALLMNFSLYITRFVVDVGNMFAIEFYSAFPVNNDPVVKNIPGIEQHSISTGFSNALILPLIGIANDVNNKNEGFAAKATVILFVGLEFLIVAFVWLISSFLLVGRIATLWMVMILSPLAFFSLAIPPVAGVNIWGKWKEELVKATFFPAVFLFFMYFAARLAQSTGFITKTFGQGTDTSITAFIPLFIQFAVIIAFIMFGLKTATSMSGKAGQMAANYGKLGTGLAGSAALGAVAWGSRQSLGRMADWARRDREAGGLGLGRSLTTSKVGRVALEYGLNPIATGNLDARSVVGSKVSGIDFGRAGGKGGFVGGKGGILGLMQTSEQDKDKRNKGLFDSLKNDPEAQMKLLASLSEEKATRVWKGLSLDQRQSYIVSDFAKNKVYKERLEAMNKNITVGGFDTEELKAEFDLWKDEPEKQAAKLEELYTSGKQNQIAPLIEKLTVKERFNAEKKTTGETQEYLKKINAERMERIAKLKPKQKETEEKEWKDLEAMNDFNISLENYRKEEDMEKKEQLSEKVKENLGKLRDEQATTIKFKDIIEVPVLQKMSEEKLKAIKKKSGSKFTWDEMDKLNELIKTKSESEVVRDTADLSPTEQAKAKKTAEAKAKAKKKETNTEIYIPTSNLSDEISSARASQNQPPP